PNFIDKNTVTTINSKIESFIEKKSKDLNLGDVHRTDDGTVNTIHVMSQESNFFSDLLNSPEFTNLAKFIIGETVQPQWAQLFNKPKNTGMGAPFHQDNYYWNVIDNKTVTIWLALDEVNETNGALSYYENSHKKGLITHEATFAKGTSQGVPKNILRQFHAESLVVPTLQPGDILLHHGLTVHGSLPNNSNKNRRGMSFWYKSASAGYDERLLYEYKKSLTNQKMKIYQND
ncbi:phytanoyl-CoA dioxygenase family protein, partial [Alphaproteobacteria bacterium]|nr:phytanoyl-CoA dioxygenase family protein [Alphaproteobacteria bacterium]